MGNMSYCRFQNTVGDLRDCAQSLRDREPLSKEEEAAAQELRALCAIIAEKHSAADIAELGQLQACENCGKGVAGAAPQAGRGEPRMCDDCAHLPDCIRFSGYAGTENNCSCGAA